VTREGSSTQIYNKSKERIVSSSDFEEKKAYHKRKTDNGNHSFSYGYGNGRIDSMNELENDSLSELKNPLNQGSTAKKRKISGTPITSHVQNYISKKKSIQSYINQNNNLINLVNYVP
jgi:hypothetical protein